MKESKTKNLAAAGLMTLGSLLPTHIKNQPLDQKPYSFSQTTPIEKTITINDFLNALHQVETGGKVGKIIGDGGRALGPLQIHRGYWSEVKDIVGGRYEDVMDLDYSKKVALAVFKKYAPEALKNKDWEKLARIHNGGPKGPKKQSTLKYWNKVKSLL